MADDRKELEIQISTKADLRGAQAAERAIDGIAKKADGVTDQQKLAAQEAVRNLTAPAYGEQLKKIFGDSKNAADQAAHAMGTAAGAGKDLSHIFHGLHSASEGGVGGILGMRRALSGVVHIFHRVGSVLAGPVGLGLGAAAAGIAYLARVAHEKQKDIEHFFARLGEESAALKSGYKELEDAGKKSLEEQIKRVEKLTNDYAKLLEMIDANDARMRESIKLQMELRKATLDRDEQRALAGANTDEERAKISADAAQRRQQLEDQVAVADVNNLRLRGLSQRRGAYEQMNKVQAERDAAQRDANEKRAASENAIEFAAKMLREKGAGSKDARDAIDNASLAKKASELAEKQLEEIVTRTRQTIEQLERQLSEANANIERATLAGQTLAIKQEAGALKGSNDAQARLRQLAQEADDAVANQDFARQDKAVAERRKIDAGLRESATRARRNAGSVADPTGLPSGASESLISIKIDEQTAYIRKGASEIVAAQQRNADAMMSMQDLIAANLEKQKRRALNAREVTP